jgi:histone-binding protein RBBP4
MPQRYNVIATKCVSGEVHIFDYTKHSTKPKNQEISPQVVLTGHEKEGYGIAWNPHKEGILVSGSDDT